MATPARIAICAVVGVCLIALAKQSPAPAQRGGGDGGAQYRLDRAQADRAHVSVLSAEQRARAFRFAPGTSADEQRTFSGAIASARPEARRLVELVDGLVSVRFEQPPGSAIGLTRFDGADYDVIIDLDAVSTRYGIREADAIVLHELGHVIDIALVPDELVAELDKDISIGENCRRGGPLVGACAPTEERFADTFSKWAMDDLGVNLASGYRILAPAPLKKWGEPLAELGR